MRMRLPRFGLLLLACLANAADAPIEAIYSQFRNPPADYSVSPYWFWNGRVTAAETERQLQAMASQGVRSAVVMGWAGLEPPFLTEAWWTQVGVALDAARRNGMTLNFADEFLWPSGEAWDYGSNNPERSRVLQLHPEYRMKRLTLRRYDAGAPVALDAAPEVVVAARVDGAGAIDEASLTLLPSARRIEWTPPGAGWKLFVYTLVEAQERGVRVDLMNPAAVRVYLDLVYGGFARRFPGHLGSTIRFFVSDHEGSYGAALPYTPALWDTFRRRHGYDLRRMLPIADRATAGAATLRQRYLDVISHLYSTSYVQQVTDWCTAHRVLHGHSDIEETLLLQIVWTGDMFRLWRASSAIYIDALIERARMPVDFMEAVSVAHFEGRPLLVENQGLVGHDSFWSLEKARAATQMALLWGANRLIPHYFEYDPTHIQYPPSWFLTQPLWRYFHHYADLVRRAQFMNAQGRHNASIALYAPLESAFAGAAGVFREGRRDVLHWGNAMDRTQDYYTALQLELARHGFEHHILDPHYLRQATLGKGALELAGERFTFLILPPMTDIAPESAERIRRFVAAGGTVAALGPQPAALDGVALQRLPIGDHKRFMDKLSYTEPIRPTPGVLDDIAPLLAMLRRTHPPDVEIAGGERGSLRFSRRSTRDGEWWWAVNDASEPRSVMARFAGAGAVEKWDPTTGERSPLPASEAGVRLDFGPFDAFYVVRRAGAAPAPSAAPAPLRVLLQLPRSGWRFTPESEIRVPYARVAGAAEPVWLAPERLANRKWWMAGPYPDDDHRGLYQPFPPESGFREGDAAWKWIESETAAVRTPERQGVFYAFVNVWSPEARRGRAAVAVADSIRLWWNGRLELTAHLHPPFVNLRDPWSYRPAIEIRKGWNTVLLKMASASSGANGFLFRITDETGATLRDLVYTQGRTPPEPAAPRRVRLQVDAPPGTRDPSIDREMEERAIPEQPFAFAPATTPFTLACWTDSSLAHYSGSALYEIDFTLDAAPSGERLWLDLGAVGLAAEVWINGEKVGERVWRPYELEVTGRVRRGTNRLRIRVANSNAGWMAQGDPIYERGAWGVKFSSERDRLRTLRPNGLEGPVRLLAGR